MSPGWMASASYPCSLEIRVEPGSTRLSLLAEQAPHARCPKVPKFHKLLVRFTRFPRPARARLTSARPPLLSLLPRLQRHGILLRKKRRCSRSVRSLDVARSLRHELCFALLDPQRLTFSSPRAHARPLAILRPRFFCAGRIKGAQDPGS